jgi:hypothetical protein
MKAADRAAKTHEGGRMPQYMLLIYGPADRSPSPEEMAAEMPRWNAYTEDLQNAGVMKAGDALHPSESATTVRVRDGETLITDGPFAETKETLGGYYLIDVPDLDAALKYAAKMPNIAYGSVEVRPVVDFSAVPSPEQQASATA